MLNCKQLEGVYAAGNLWKPHFPWETNYQLLWETYDFFTKQSTISLGNCLGKASTKKLIIFMEFSMEGFPPPRPAPLPWKIINFFPTIF